MSGEPPTKKARGSVEDDEFPITEGTQDYDDSFAEWFEKYEKDERLNVEMEDINIQIAVQASLANEKIEEKTKEIEPAVNPSWVLTWVDVKRDVKSKRMLRGVEPATTVELEKVLKQVHKASSGSEDNMSLMMTGP